jgi:thioredoxin 1
VITYLTTDTFQPFIEAMDKPVIVDYWAEWCQPCKQMLLVLNQIAEENPEYVVAKVNVDEEEELAEGLTNIPTIKVFLGGLEVGRISGAKPKAALLELIASKLT